MFSAPCGRVTRSEFGSHNARYGKDARLLTREVNIESAPILVYLAGALPVLLIFTSRYWGPGLLNVLN